MGIFDGFKKKKAERERETEKQREKEETERQYAKVNEERKRQVEANMRMLDEAGERRVKERASINSTLAGGDPYIRESLDMSSRIEGSLDAMENLPGARKSRIVAANELDKQLQELEALGRIDLKALREKGFNESPKGRGYRIIWDIIFSREEGKKRADELKIDRAASTYILCAPAKHQALMLYPYLLEKEALGILNEDENKLLVSCKKIYSIPSKSNADIFRNLIIDQAKSGFFGEEYTSPEAAASFAKTFKGLNNLYSEINSMGDQRTTGRRR
jgi:hypothetical protein